MRLRVVRPQLDRSQQKPLGVLELPLLEQNQSEVGVEDEDVRILFRQAAVDHLRLGIRVGLEVDETEEIEDVGVIRTKLLCVLQVAAGLGESGFLERFAATVVVEKKNALIEWRLKGGRGIPITHETAIVALLRSEVAHPGKHRRDGLGDATGEAAVQCRLSAGSE